MYELYQTQADRDYRINREILKHRGMSNSTPELPTAGGELLKAGPILSDDALTMATLVATAALSDDADYHLSNDHSGTDF